jgi:N-methylhydantoinase A
MTQSFAIDVGGTFTDLVVLDRESGEVTFAKVPTQPQRPADGVLAAIARSDLDVRTAAMFFHGTTLGMNSMLEGKGARTGLLTTRGFRDVIELRRMSWPMYRLHWQPPAPLIPRFLRREVQERIRADGTEQVPLCEEDVLSETESLVAEGVEAIAVCFMHAYAFPAHEIRAAELIHSRFPQVSVTLSHQVSQEYREYERTVTTIGDASIKRRMEHYLDDLEGRLRDARFPGAFVITRCDGGVMGAAEAKTRPIRTLLSGPASGVMGAAMMSRWLGIPNVIAADMGGTSFDASLIVDHEPHFETMTEIGDLPLLVPVIDITTIGAGGGSIASIDGGGALRVGPESAGADPGPVCYGRGGELPTFTDAALVSGLLDPEDFLGGEIGLLLDRSRQAIAEQIGVPLGMGTEEAAAGIVALAEAKMAATLEELTIGKGKDPRDFTLVAYGGGGSLVAGSLAGRLHIPRVVVPQSPATFSAWGMLTLNVVHDFARTAVQSLAEVTVCDIEAAFDELARRAEEALRREGVATARRTLLRSVDARYESQEHVLTLPVEETFLRCPNLSALRKTFDRAHQRVYGYALPDPVEITGYRTRAVGVLDKPRQPRLPIGGGGADAARVTFRTAIHTESGGRMEWDVYRRECLGTETRLQGPAIVQETSATTLVGPTDELTVDQLGNLVITVGAS